MARSSKKEKSIDKQSRFNETDQLAESNVGDGLKYTNNLHNLNNNNIIINNYNNHPLLDTDRYAKNTEREIKIGSMTVMQDDVNKVKQARLINQQKKFFINKKEIFEKGYKIKDPIGSGSYAHVFKARDFNKQQNVALKLIELNKISKNYRIFMKREIQVIRQLNHPNIIQLYHGFNTSFGYVMVMELAENGTFADILFKNGVTPDSIAKNLFRGVGEGVNYMHRKLIAHRDLKLENILLKGSSPKISDFSLSLLWDGQTLCREFCGTPPYFPPEIFRKVPHNPIACDMWSLGVCIYIMLNDSLPFREDNPELILEKQLKGDWKFNKRYEATISNEAKTIINKLLDPNPKTRMKSSEFITGEWFKKPTGKQQQPIETN